MNSSFDDPPGQYLALVYNEGQRSLWPPTAPVLTGWTVVHGPTDRQTWLDHVEWMDGSATRRPYGRGGNAAALSEGVRE